MDNSIFLSPLPSRFIEKREVAEFGEFYVRPTGGLVPHERTGGMTVNIHVTGVADAQSFRASSGQIVAETTRCVASARARNM
ncbi:MAG: hypothetical protein ABW189_02865 [Rickettsiales bacterium]